SPAWNPTARTGSSAAAARAARSARSSARSAGDQPLALPVGLERRDPRIALGLIGRVVAGIDVAVAERLAAALADHADPGRLAAGPVGEFRRARLLLSLHPGLA